MKILIHICCAPCFAYPHNSLDVKGHEVVGYWYNPNIHPYMEYKAREDALKKYATIENVEVIYDDYPFIDYLKMQINNIEGPTRCKHCYLFRLEKTAMYAKDHAFDAFTSTLLASPHQSHKNIKKIGENVSDQYDIMFYYEDFRLGWNQNRAIAKTHGLYSQRYCGCLISEWERFDKDHKKLKPQT